MYKPVTKYPVGYSVTADNSCPANFLTYALSSPIQVSDIKKARLSLSSNAAYFKGTVSKWPECFSETRIWYIKTSLSIVQTLFTSKEPYLNDPRAFQKLRFGTYKLQTSLSIVQTLFTASTGSLRTLLNTGIKKIKAVSKPDIKHRYRYRYLVSNPCNMLYKTPCIRYLVWGSCQRVTSSAGGSARGPHFWWGQSAPGSRPTITPHHCYNIFKAKATWERYR